MTNHDARIALLAQSRLFPILLVLIAMLGPLSMLSIVPALPAIQQTFQISPTLTQMVLSLSLFAMAASSLVYGGIADRIGRRPALLGGILLATVGSVIASQGPSIEWVILGRALQAIGGGAGYTLVRVMVTDVYGDKRATSMLGYVTAAMALSPMAAPILGGLLIDHLGWRYVFGAVAVIAGVLFVLITLQLPETGRPNAAPASGLAKRAGAGWRDLFRRPDYVRYLTVGTTLQATFFAFTAGAPYLLIQSFGMDATSYGTHYLVVPLGFLMGSLIAGRLGSRFSIERMVAAGALGALVSSLVALVWLGNTDDTPWAILLPMVFGAISAGIALPATQSGLVAAASDQPGVASGVFSFVQMTGSAFVAQLVGIGLAPLGELAVTGPMFGASLIGAIGFYFLTRRSRRLTHQPA